MSIKTAVKRALLGKTGVRPRRIRMGLLRGLRFNVDTASKGMRLLGLDEREIATRANSHKNANAMDLGPMTGGTRRTSRGDPNISTVIACEPGDGLDDTVRSNLAHE